MKIASAASVSTVVFTDASLFTTASTSWTISFKASATGALTSTSTVSAIFPSAVTVPSTFNIGVSITSGFTGTCSPTAAVSGQTVVVTLGGTCALANSATGVFKLTGFYNPTTAQTLSNTGFLVATSADNTSAVADGGTSPVITASQLSDVNAGLVVAGSSQTVVQTGAAGAAATYAWGLYSAQALGSGATITVAYPAGITVPASTTFVSEGGFAGACTGIGTSTSGQQITITLATNCTLAATTVANFDLTGNFVNPSAATYSNTGTYPTTGFWMYTSAAGTPMADNQNTGITFTAATTPSAVNFTDNSASAGAATTWNVGFTSSSLGALGSTSTATIVFPSAVTVPGSTTVTIVSGFTGTCAPTAVVTGQTVKVTFGGTTCSLCRLHWRRHPTLGIHESLGSDNFEHRLHGRHFARRHCRN